MDMDFMNLNQSAHGDREFGHICARMRLRRKVVVGHWSDAETQRKIAVWQRVAAAWADSQDMLILRFGDQMNNVAVTDGDKVEAELRLGYHVDYTPVSELMEYYKKVSDEDVDALVATYSNYMPMLPSWKTKIRLNMKRCAMPHVPNWPCVQYLKQKVLKVSQPISTILEHRI